jgi:hypothetical protein
MDPVASRNISHASFAETAAVLPWLSSLLHVPSLQDST